MCAEHKEALQKYVLQNYWNDTLSEPHQFNLRMAVDRAQSHSNKPSKII